MAVEHPTLVTVEARKARRRAPVYLDVMRNAAGQTIVPPFSVRWRPRAPVSMPLDWDEVSPRLDPNVFTIRTAERRMGRAALVQLFRPSPNAAAGVTRRNRC